MADPQRRSQSRIARAREETISVLEMRHKNDKIGASECERMIEVARNATSTGELDTLLRATGSPQAPVRRPLDALEASDLELDPADEHGVVLALMGGAQRKGAWEPPARLYVSSIMGGVELDFRQADMLEGVTQVIVLSVMGSVSIIVPSDLRVESNGFGLLGGFSHIAQRPAEDHAPVLKVTGLAVMGGVAIKVK